MPAVGKHTAIVRAAAAAAFLLVLPFACLLAVTKLDPALEESADWSLRWANALPVALGVLLLWTVLGRVLLSGWIGFWLLWLLHALNAAKLEQLHRALTPDDLDLLGQVAGNLDLFVRYAMPAPLQLLGGLGVVLAGIALARLEPRTLPRLRWRLPMIAASLVLLASLLAGHDPWRRLLHDQALAGFQIWSPDKSLERSGLAAGLLRLGWQPGISVAPPDSEQRAALAHFSDSVEAELAALAAVAVPQQPPDLIVVQSEALFDPGRLRGLEEEDWLPQWRALAARGLHGNLSVPTYGGGTIRTEFEVLTGYPMAAFPGVVYPYFGLTDSALPALPERLARFGYRRLVVHPYERSFWNRDAALAKLGFNDMQFERDSAFRDPGRRGPYVSDDVAFEATLELLAEDQPQFVFVITMENHSPWSEQRRNIDAARRDAIVVPEALEPRLRAALQGYLLHLREGDRALGSFARRVLQRERPTLLLVYGDHLPSLTPVFEQIGFDDGAPAWEQPVPWLLVGNVSVPRQRRDLAAHQLPAMLMQLAGLPVDGYLALSAVLRDRMHGCANDPQCTRIHELQQVAARLDYSN